MSDENDETVKVKYEIEMVDFGKVWLAFVLLIIAFGGEPDLIDAIIHALMK